MHARRATRRRLRAGSVTSTKLKVSGIDVFSAGDFAGGDGHARTSCCATPRAASTSASCCATTGSSARCSTATPPTAPGTSSCCATATDVSADPRRADLRPGLRGGRRPRGPSAAVAALSDDAEICGCNGVSQGQDRRGDRATRACARSTRCAPIPRPRPPAARAPAWSKQLLALHARRRLSRARRRSSRCASAPTSATTTCAALSSRKALKTIPAVMQELHWTTPDGCLVPPGAELLPALRLARRLSRRPAVPLRQRADARQHPEGRHLFGGAADVGRPHQPARAARDRRRGREVQHADGQGHRRPAHRPARHQEGGPAGGLGRPQRRRHGLRPRLRQGAAHGEDLRRLRMVPLRHAGFRPASASSSRR